MVAGHGRKAQEGPCGGYAGLFEKVEQFLLGVTQNNALAHQGQGFPGKVDQSRRRLNLFGLHFWCGPVAADEAYGLIVVVEARKLGVFGDVDEYRSGTSAAGNVKGTGNGIGNVFGLFYLKIPLGDGLGNAYHVGLLEGVTQPITKWNFQVKKRSEEHTSELQSRPHLVCRLLLEKKKN